MSISSLLVRHVYAELPEPMRSRGNVGYTEFFHTGSERQRISAIEIRAASGHAGVTLLGGAPETVDDFLEAVAWPALRDEAPWRMRHLRKKLLTGAAAAGERFERVARSLVNRLEFGLWDLAAKEAGLPLYRLLGGGPARGATVYAGGGSLCWNPLPLLVEETEALLEHGFRALKIKIGHGPDEDAEIIRALRRVAGRDIRILVDANRAYDLPGALRLLPALEAEGIDWFEEPLVYDRPEEWRQVRAASNVKIAGGEGFGRLQQVADAAREGMLDIYQCDAGGFGLEQLLAIASLTEEHGASLTPHSCNSVIGFVVSLHLQLAIPNTEIQEFETFANPFVQEIFNEPITLLDGCVEVPDAPGHGFTLNEEMLGVYRVGERGWGRL